MLKRISNPLLTRNLAARRIGFALGILLTVLSGILISFPFLGEGFARFSYDFPFILQHRVPEELIMVYLDADVKRRLGQPADQPLDRRFYTRLLNRLAKEHARLVLIDIIFDEPAADSNVDQEFAAAMRAQGHVVLVAEEVDQTQANYHFFNRLILPTPALKEAAAAYGIANVDDDKADSGVREIYGGSDVLASASWAAAAVLGMPLAKIPSERFKARWLNYWCPPAELRAVNLDHALEPLGLADGYFTGKLVIVGTRPGAEVAGARSDVFANPYSRFGYSRFGGALTPGAAVHGLSLLNLVYGDWLVRHKPAEELAIIVIWGCLLSVLLLRLPPPYAVAAAFVLSSLFAGVSAFIQLRHHVWFAWAIPVAVQAPVALVWGVTYRYLVESRRRQRLRRAFAVYVSPHMADRIANSDFDLAPGGKEVEATIMFTDLEGFTKISESLPPAEVSALLVAYFNQTTRAILDQDGAVIKFIGDAVLAAWGAPLPSPHPSERAVVAAWNMIEAGKQEIAGRRLRTRIGINTGMVLAGNLGSDTRFDYTLIGDAINVAARLEPLNKQLGTQILISESTRAGLSERIGVRRLGRFAVAGRTNPIEVHEVIEIASSGPKAPWLGEFGRALESLEHAEFDRAAAGFEAVMRMRGGSDGPSEFFMRILPGLRANALQTSGWDGVVRLEPKQPT